MRIVVVISVLILQFCSSVLGQDAFFSNNYFHKLYWNPAYTGLGYQMKTNLSYRHQWHSDGAPTYRTMYASLEYTPYCYGPFISIGGYVLADREFNGAVKNTNSNISVAVGMPIDAGNNTNVKAEIMLGLSAGIVSRALDLSDEGYWGEYVLSGNNFDPLVDIGALSGSKTAEDINAGMALNLIINKKHRLLMGASGMHLTTPKLVNNEIIYRKFTGNVAATFMIGGKIPKGIIAYSDFAFQQKFYRHQTGFIVGRFSKPGLIGDKLSIGIRGGVSINGVGDESTAYVLESISGMVVFNYEPIEITFVKDFSISTHDIAKHRGGSELILRFKIFDSPKLKMCDARTKYCPKFK